MIEEVKFIHWNCANKASRFSEKESENWLALPGYFPLLTDSCKLSWQCPNCKTTLILQWPVEDTDLQLVKVPSTKYHDLSFLNYLASVSERFEMITLDNLSYIKDTETNLSPSLISMDCTFCNSNHVLSYAIGIGREKSPEPNTLVIKGIWCMKKKSL
ncbi:MAG: hypothetical protein KIPDCIKN_02307 [Haliscomenobacter sp.]|jgi:hypothetical protein|nr:hypothetical protein [Haliscomenobacter sp.]